MKPWKLADIVGSFLMIAFLVVIVQGGMSQFSLIKEFLEKGTPKTNIILFLIQTVIFLIVLLLFTRYKYGSTFKDLGFKTISIKRTLFLMMQGYGLWLVISYIMVVLMFHTGRVFPGYDIQAPTLPLFGEGRFAIIAAFLAAVIVAPLVEEAFFRGFVLQTSIQRLGTTYGSLFAAALFAIIHFQFSNIIPLFILGLIINWIFLRDKSLWPAIFFHAFNNGLALTLEVFLHDEVNTAKLFLFDF